ncbi:MAG: glycosyl hydrolase [bacterium]
MFSLFLRCSVLSFILTISIVCNADIRKEKESFLINNSKATNKSFYPEDFKFLWVEAEDAIDHSFHQLQARIIPDLFESPQMKGKRKRTLSNGHLFYIEVKEEPWHKEGYYIKYEVIIPKEGNYSLYVREVLSHKTSPVKWRFDRGRWKIVKDLKRLPNARDSQNRRKIKIEWVNYGNVLLSKGRHVLQLVIEKNRNSGYSKQIDAFVLAKDKFTPNGIFKPEGTIEITNLLLEKTVNITLNPDKEMTDAFHKFRIGVSFLMEWYEEFVHPKRPELYKEVFKIMDNIDVSFTRYTLFLNRIFPVPDFSSSPQWDRVKNWFERRGVEVKNNEDIFKSLKEKNSLQRAFYKFIERENIIFKAPLKTNNYLDRINKYYVPLNSNKFKLIQCVMGIPRWLSSNSSHKRFLTFPPKDYSAYAKLWELTVAYFTSKYPNIEQYWEVHNEPEVYEYLRIIGENIRVPGSYRKEKFQSYFRMYDAALEGAIKANPKIKIGGPASCTSVRDNYIESFINHCRNENKKLDFISWHIYNEQPIILKNQIQKVQSLLDRYGLKNVELIVDEWAIGFPTIEGIDPNWRKSISRIVNGNINAAFAAACLQTMIENELYQSIYFSLRMSTGYGSGLIIEDIHKSPVYTKKPIYYTFKLFSMLNNKRIEVEIDSKQNIGAIATKSDDAKQINLLIWNYDPIERMKERNIRIKLLGIKNIKYDHYLIDSNHTLLGAEELDMVGKDVTFDSVIELELESNSVTLLRIKL